MQEEASIQIRHIVGPPVLNYIESKMLIISSLRVQNRCIGKMSVRIATTVLLSHVCGRSNELTKKQGQSLELVLEYSIVSAFLSG